MNEAKNSVALVAQNRISKCSETVRQCNFIRNHNLKSLKIRHACRKAAYLFLLKIIEEIQRKFAAIPNPPAQKHKDKVPGKMKLSN
jgi:hypothetical protein